jgi:hypothetical protein
MRFFLGRNDNGVVGINRQNLTLPTVVAEGHQRVWCSAKAKTFENIAKRIFSLSVTALQPE